MSASERSSSLTHLARLGFARLAEADDLLTEIETESGLPRATLMAGAARAADPDEALSAMARIARRDAAALRDLHADTQGWNALWALLGASTGFADFFLRQPGELAHLVGAGASLPSAAEMRDELLDSVGTVDGFASDHGEAAWVALRVRYRRM